MACRREESTASATHLTMRTCLYDTLDARAMGVLARAAHCADDA